MAHASGVLLLALALVCHSAAFAPLQLAPVHRRRPAAAGVRMAAAKKKPAVAFKGFGAMPQKLENRVPESADEPCECQSGLAYGQCCKPFHDGEKWPETPLQLMRSRYTGYAYRLPDWIIDTTHRTNSDWKSARSKWFNELLGFCDGFHFNGLDILEDKAGDNGEHYIEFVAKMAAREASPTDAPKGVKQILRRVKYQAGTDKVAADFRERSKFVKEDGKWMYQGGDVNFDPKATLIMEDGTRLDAPEAKPDPVLYPAEQLAEDVKEKPDHPAFKKTGLRTYKAN